MGMVAVAGEGIYIRGFVYLVLIVLNNCMFFYSTTTISGTPPPTQHSHYYNKLIGEGAMKPPQPP